MAGDDHDYHPQDAVNAAMRGTAFTGTAGFLIASLRTALHKSNVGAMAVFTRNGGIIVSLALAGGAYSFTKAAVSNLRKTDDAYNAALGGFLAGAIVGTTRKKMPFVLRAGAITAVTMGLFDATGSRLRGWTDRPEEEEFDRKMRLRANRRRPMEETIAEIGEGRGIQPPGYEERRRERLLEKYGIEIDPVKATSK